MDPVVPFFSPEQGVPSGQPTLNAVADDDWRLVVGGRRPWPVYTLDERWRGPRYLGDFEISHAATEDVLSHLSIIHGEPPLTRHAALVEVHVSAASVQAAPAALGRLDLLDPDDSTGWQPASGRPEADAEVLLAVGGRPTPFTVWRQGPQWVALHEAGAHAITVEGRGLEPADVVLVAVADLRPYLQARDDLLDRLRTELLRTAGARS